MHIDLLKQSFRYILKNPSLYLPDIAMAAITSILLYFIYLYTGAADFLSLLRSAETLSVDLFTSYLSENLKELILSGIMFFFVSFIFGVGVIVFKFLMIKNILLGKKVSFAVLWAEKKGLFWAVVLLRIYVYILSLLTLGFLVILGFGVYFLFLPFHESIALAFSLALTVFLGVIFLILIKLATLFRYPFLFLSSEKNSLSVLKASSLLFKKKPLFVLKTWGIVVLLTIIFWAGTYILDTFIQMSLSFFSLLTIAMILGLLWSIINMLLNITIDLWTTIYVFLRFQKKDTTE